MKYQRIHVCLTFVLALLTVYLTYNSSHKLTPVKFQNGVAIKTFIEQARLMSKPESERKKLIKVYSRSLSEVMKSSALRNKWVYVVPNQPFEVEDVTNEVMAKVARKIKETMRGSHA